ncbi:MAG: MFS transporter [Treponema sp.]|nr:MFS transporter [Treponema sp.]
MTPSQVDQKESRSRENRFIPSYVFMFAAPAVTAPYLAILLRDLGYSPIWVGILLGVFSGAGIVGPFAFGFWADRTRNYRHGLITSVIIPTLVSLPLVIWVHPAFSVVFLALMAFGLRSTASLLDSVTTIQIGNTGNYGRIRVWGSVSFIAVTLILQITPFLRPDSARNIALWLTVVSALSVVPILLLPKADLSSSAGPKTGGKSMEKGLPIFSAYVIGGLGIIFVVSFSMSAVYSYFPLYLTEILEWDVVGLMFAIGAASELPVIFLSAMLLRRFGPLPLLAVSAAGVSLRLLIWAFFPFGPLVLASQLLHALCFGTFFPAKVYFIASVFPPKNRGTGMSLFIALGTGLPSLIGTMVGGGILEAMAGAEGFRFLFILYAAIAGLGILIYGAMRLGRVWEERRGC